MDINSNRLLVTLKSFARETSIPLDSSELYDNLTAAKEYANKANAYEGQTIKVKNSNGEYDIYILQPQYNSDGDKIGLSPVLFIGNSENSAQYIQAVDSIDSIINPKENNIYLVYDTENNKVKEYIYSNNEFINVSSDIDLTNYSTIEYVDNKIGDLGYKIVDTGRKDESGNPIMEEIPLTVSEAIEELSDGENIAPAWGSIK